jgi:hypothetical protein
LSQAGGIDTASIIAGKTAMYWKNRNVFERQWISRDFKKQTGTSVDEMAGVFTNIDLLPAVNLSRLIVPMQQLRNYYTHQEKLVRGCEKKRRKSSCTPGFAIIGSRSRYLFHAAQLMLTTFP